MFCVYGKSKFSAKKTVAKKLLNKKSDVSVAISKLKTPTQNEKQSIFDEFVSQEFIDCKAKRCTHEFSTPEISKEALVIMQKDDSNFSDLVLMKKINKLNVNGEALLNKRTRKPQMIWVRLID